MRVAAHGNGLDEVVTVVFTLVVIAAVWVAARRGADDGTDDE